RVWEQEMTSTLSRAGIKYTLVDDSHFKNAGLLGDKLLGYYLTEDQGALTSVFGTNERLRYIIPFREPEEIRQYLWEISETRPGSLLVYGDDGEKFGGWPGTHEWVYEKGWLDRFFRMLQENRDWIELITPGEALNRFTPSGKIYIPDSSYREMMEWALPLESGKKYEYIESVLKVQPIWNEASAYIRGGFWRNFIYKYPEINHMYSRMLEVSGKIASLKGKAPKKARTLLHKAQCNCPYWHGVFGGIYLNHLRFETYRNLIRADALLNKKITQGEDFIEVEESDFDLDNRPETALHNRWHRLYVQPHHGGRIYEWDYYPARTNLLDTLSRREETYHKTIREAADMQSQENTQSIHDTWKLHDPSIKDHLIYDPYERKSFIDHIMTGEISPRALKRNECREHGRLAQKEYNCTSTVFDDEVMLQMTYDGGVEIDGTAHHLTIEKSVILKKSDPAVSCSYTVTNKGEQALDCRFGTEWNFALLAGQAEDRYYFYEDGSKAGVLAAELQKDGIMRFGVADEWQGLKIGFEFSEPVSLYTFPIETVSQSESAYEKVYQSSVLLPVVHLELGPGDFRTFSFQIIPEHTG
ncbi:alpha-amylase/4-alpha-glucanotransferase domain-containing protein, partial [candidate division KSB1 bacterium]